MLSRVGAGRLKPAVARPLRPAALARQSHAPVLCGGGSRRPGRQWLPAARRVGAVAAAAVLQLWRVAMGWLRTCCVAPLLGALARLCPPSAARGAVDAAGTGTVRGRLAGSGGGGGGEWRSSGGLWPLVLQAL
jgi:hypothetical protein